MAEDPSASSGIRILGPGNEGVAADSPAPPEVFASVRSGDLSEAMGRVRIAVVVWNEEGTIILGNESAAALYGLPLDELVGRRVTELAEPADLVERTVAALVAGAFDSYHATRLLGSNDHETLVQTTTRAVEVDGHRVGVSLLVPETELLQPDRNPWNRRLDLVPVAIGCADPDLTIEVVSLEIEELVGLTPDQSVGRRLLDLIAPEDVPAVEHAMGNAGLTAPVSIPRIRFRGSAGQSPAVCVLLAPRQHKGGRSVAFALVGRIENYWPQRPDRVAELELHLRRIGAEVRAAGVLSTIDTIPGLKEFPELGELTSRQWEILDRLLRGERVPTIANELFISASTVRNHLSKIFEKFGVHKQSELIELLRPSVDALRSGTD
jgi:PAS domain-containing protein/DNA-binding CsgD family transcriptional regulator